MSQSKREGRPAKVSGPALIDETPQSRKEEPWSLASGGRTTKRPSMDERLEDMVPEDGPLDPDDDDTLGRPVQLQP